MLFSPLLPMEPVANTRTPEGPNYLYQVKWDGVRIVAHVGRDSVLLHNRKLRERTYHYPELSLLSEQIDGEAILDGEVVALKSGKPNFPLVLERDLLTAAAGTGERVRLAMARVPIFYIIFDLVFYNGKTLTQVPLEERLAKLREITSESETIRVTEDFDDGPALFGIMEEQKMEGILAKERSSFYFPGKKINVWQKIKVRQRQLVVIGGFTVKEGQINALLAGAYYKGNLIYVGRVATGLSARDFAGLNPYLRGSQRPTPPFVNAKAEKNKVWVEPRLVALIEFHEWTGDLRMRAPVIKGFTQDRPRDCVLD